MTRRRRQRAARESCAFTRQTRWSDLLGGKSHVSGSSTASREVCPPTLKVRVSLPFLIIGQPIAQCPPQANRLCSRDCDSDTRVAVHGRSRVAGPTEGEVNTAARRVSINLWLSRRSNADIAHAQTVPVVAVSQSAGRLIDAHHQSLVWRYPGRQSRGRLIAALAARDGSRQENDPAASAGRPPEISTSARGQVREPELAYRLGGYGAPRRHLIVLPSRGDSGLNRTSSP
jgi:hypothetical protein